MKLIKGKRYQFCLNEEKGRVTTALFTGEIDEANGNYLFKDKGYVYSLSEENVKRVTK